MTRQRVGLVAQSVWRDGLRVLRERETAAESVSTLWPLLFGEAQALASPLWVIRRPCLETGGKGLASPD